MRKSKNRYFYHIFVSPGDAPGAITLNHVEPASFINKLFRFFSLPAVFVKCSL